MKESDYSTSFDTLFHIFVGFISFCIVSVMVLAVIGVLYVWHLISG